MATLKEIAEESSVSIATVSNILNGKGNVSEETAKKVLKIAQKYNYVPNIYARNLKSQSLNIIGVITEDLTIFHTPEIVDGINYYCEKQGYSFVLGNMRLYKLYQDAYFFSDQYTDQFGDSFRRDTAPGEMILPSGVVFCCFMF